MANVGLGTVGAAATGFHDQLVDPDAHIRLGGLATFQRRAGLLFLLRGCFLLFG